MKAVIQRVMSASVRVEGRAVGNIVDGLLVLPGVANGDGESDDRFLIEKIRTLRIFPDEQGKMNRSLLVDNGGSVLLVSQFTLLGRTANSRRPIFDDAGPSDEAKRLYEQVAVGL
jgi:D-tyrosyl-tRNA(Tyr) deacylase